MSGDEVKELITKAAKSSTADDAMRFSQAACNAAKALRELDDLKTVTTTKGQ